MSIAQKSLAILATAVVAVAIVWSLAATINVAEAATLTESQIQSIISLLQNFGADAATIANVSASLHGTPTTPTTPAGVCPFTWTRSLTTGATGADVLALQKFLNADSSTQVAVSGAGSPGNETSFFGPATGAAVTKFQLKYTAQILTPLGLTNGTAFFGASSRAKANELCAAGGPVVTLPPTGTGLSVSAGLQPANALAPQGAQRVEFTKFTLTAGADGPVTVNSVTVERVGAGNNAAFSGVILIDQDGNQLGNSRSFNSNNQTTIGEAVTIPAGQSRTYTVAGNMAASLTAYVGQAPGIAVIAVNTLATVSGSLPITGAFHTTNSSLTVGSLTLAASQAYASNSTSTSKEIGTTNYRVTGFSLTAGSAEDLKLKMLRLQQAGSASTLNDIANIKIGIDGTLYPVTVSADGKYVVANLGSGILLPKGNKLEAYVQYDIVGANSSSRTVIFHVDKSTDIFAVGQTYGYGATISGGSAGTPYYFGMSATISGASVTTIQKAISVPAQNIAPNVTNQVLGGFEIDIKGEAITVQSMAFTVATTGAWTAASGVITNISLVDENGAVVAGPIDEASTCTTGCTITFTDAVTLKTGKHTFTLRGKLPSGAAANSTVIVSATPSSGWTNAKGDLTGNSITFTQGAFAMNTMTVQAGSIAVGRATSPASQSVVAGGTSVLMANFQFDATQSGEDVRFSTVPVQTLVTGGTTASYGNPSLLTNCQLYDGAAQLNTGSNVLNPSTTATTSADTNTITLDNPVTVTKGTVKTLGMRCNISSTVPAAAEYLWDTQAASTFSFTGSTSGSSITGTNASDSNILITIAAGAVTVSIDASSPGYKLVSAGTADVVAGAYKFRASNEAVNLQKLGLTLTNTASSSAGDVAMVSVYDGATKVGVAFFSGDASTATSTFTQTVLLPKDTDKTLTIKVDYANIGTGQATAFSGRLVAINYLNAEGVGAESGLTRAISAAAGSTAVAGQRVFKSSPTVALDTLPSTGIADGRLMRFKVTADLKGPVGLTELNLLFATTTATISNVNIFAYEDSSYSNPVSGIGSAGSFNNNLSDTIKSWASGTTNFEFTAHNGTASTSLQVPAGGTRYFEVRGTVTGSASGASITTTLQGASAFKGDVKPNATSTNPLSTSTNTVLGNDFIWSPNSTTTAVRADNDWTGGFGVPGLPANGLINTRSN
ncbi:MAG: hypothetical protein Q7R74_00655 [bacterium]|nr:hypothetical protein [bacterium]